MAGSSVAAACPESCSHLGDTPAMTCPPPVCRRTRPSGAIFTEAFLSFIGLGVVPPVPSWGSLCNDGIRSMLAHPHELAVPAAFISITVLAFNLLGDGLRDALDTRTGPA